MLRSGQEGFIIHSTMKKFLPLSFSCCLLLLASSCAEPSDEPDRSVDFTADWTFRLGNDSSVVQPDYDDSGWRKLNLPHDWAIEGDFSQDNPSRPTGGALPGGIGWYRKTFTVSDRSKQYFIDFGGIYMNSTVYLNGHQLGFRPYGYISFSYEMTPYINWDEKNVLVVKVDNEKQPNSRWYSGCGIYRSVCMRAVNPVHVAQWGTYVTAENVSEHGGKLIVRTAVENNDKAEEGKVVYDAAIKVRTVLLDADGKTVAEAVTDELQIIPVGQTKEITQELHVTNPKLWDIDRPYLYRVKTELRMNGKSLIDTYDTPFGIRSFTFDAQKGFFLNGKRVKINGVCLHHDLGCLGAAFNTRAMERNLQLLKEMGCNGIRSSHNPPAPELLDLCDRMGFIVMDEAFDMWYKKKTQYDYANYFREWYERDLKDLIVRDRNHPSIFIWSIGNEVIEQYSNPHADNLSPEEANFLLNFAQGQADKSTKGDEMSFNSKLTKRLTEIVKETDPTRPVTAACNFADPGNLLIKSGALDIIGYNYHIPQYDAVPRLYPGKPFIVTESVSGLATRGYYRMPSDSMFVWPSRWDKPFHDPSFSCSAYDNCHVPWGSTQEEMWKAIKDKDFISGQYIWTGIDYIGEPTPYPWPARSSYFGLIDLCGFPKDVYYMYQSEWRPDKTVLHLYPHWNWQEGQEIDMWAYYNNADETELFINGTSQGIRRKERNECHVVWRVKYEPGTVKVVSRKNGNVISEREIHTAGEPAQIRLTPDRNTIRNNGKDLSYIIVEVLDKDGNPCPNADNEVTFDVRGDGFIAGVDNGNPVSMERFKTNHRKAFYGKCLVVVQGYDRKGQIDITATADNLNEANVSIAVR
ncbi:glycoside hydrolase, family 2, sugar binding domain protein [Bacteroidetes bacterium oral taxon 272 str. F0290]|nr:glycoside hydrolase, family 2, sugar binding domain protein [Bacteroidetes bacterium oral taxon 272 str. F0290]